MRQTPLVGFRFPGLAAALALGLTAGDASAATVVVNDTSDLSHACAGSGTGTCSLRDAIQFANLSAGTTINFSIPGAGVHTITPLSSLPNITAATTIDGYSQPLSAPNTNGPGLPDNAILLIELNGVNASYCLAVGPTTGGGTTIRGLVINRCPGDGILLSSSTGGNTVRGNFIGTDPTGTISRGVGSSGVEMYAQSTTPESNDVVGGTSPADRNIISGGGLAGITAGTGSGHLVQGNFIGTDATGTHALPNGSGLVIESASDTIGGTIPAARNVISGNSNNGVSIGSFVGDTNATLNVVEGNFIGTDVTGSIALGNGGPGVYVNGVINTIGGTTAGSGNVISGNLGFGVYVATGIGSFVQGNLIGTDATGTANLGNKGRGVMIATHNITVGGTAAGAGNVIAYNGSTDGIGGGVVVIGATSVGNAIQGNSIFSNTSTAVGRGLGIDLNADGVTPNDACDADTGPNNLQNYPVLTAASAGATSTTIQGTLNSVASTTYRIEFFANDSCDPSGYGEGKTFLGFTNVTTDVSCNVPFNVTLPVVVSPTARLTATATDPANNTSEFCSCLSVQAQFYTIQPCRIADTRTAPGPYGGPSLNTNGDRSFVVAGQCTIPADAQAVAFNFAIVQPTSGGHITVYPGGGSLPLAATMNYSAGQIRANNAIVPLGPAGDVLVHLGQGAGTTSDLVIDVNGYYR